MLTIQHWALLCCIKSVGLRSVVWPCLSSYRCPLPLRGWHLVYFMLYLWVSISEGLANAWSIELPGSPGKPLQVVPRVEGHFAGGSSELHNEDLHMETSRDSQAVLPMYSCTELPPCQRETAPDSSRGSCSDGSIGLCGSYSTENPADRELKPS